MDIEFIEPHAVTGTGGQDWPVEHKNRDAEVAAHIAETEQEVVGHE